MEKNNSDTKVKAGCFIIVCLIFFIPYICSQISPKVTKTDAIDMSREFVRKQLLAPSTAKFSVDSDVSQSGDTWMVDSYVDSQNLYGAMIRNDYSCILKTTNKGKTWTCLSLKIGDKYY